MLPVLRYRRVIPFSCAASRALAICTAYFSAVPIESDPFRVPPGTNSITSARGAARFRDAVNLRDVGVVQPSLCSMFQPTIQNTVAGCTRQRLRRDSMNSQCTGRSQNTLDQDTTYSSVKDLANSGIPRRSSLWRLRDPRAIRRTAAISVVATPVACVRAITDCSGGSVRQLRAELLN